VSQRLHKAPVTAVKYISADAQAASTSIDGSIIIWDMRPSGGQKPLQKISQMDTPPARGPDGTIITGIIQLQYNENSN
jgi:WD40 repeat protein